MPRSYRHINQYEDEIIELRSQGITKRKICEKYGFTMKQLTNFITRYNEKQRKIKTGIAIRTKGRPPKDYEITEDMKINELKYIIARKHRLTRAHREKQLKMSCQALHNAPPNRT